MTQPSRIAVALGDPNGIGPEIVLKAVRAYAGRTDLTLTVYGPATVLARLAADLELPTVCDCGHSIVPTPELPHAAYQPGRICAEAGLSAVQSATAAIEATRARHHDAVVAAPHHELAVHQAGVDFSGYPSLVARVCGIDPNRVFLLLLGGGLRIVHVTLHESLHSALGRLTPDLVKEAAMAGVRALRQLGISAPRVGLMGIDPHAGEAGLFGDTDRRITEPAAAQLHAAGLEVVGPVGADVLLAQRNCDLYVAMVHDQGHIPIKLLSPRGAAAVSIGADVLLSSVAHGSAMDIAGRGVARPDALIEAIGLLAAVPTLL